LGVGLPLQKIDEERLDDADGVVLLWSSPKCRCADQKVGQVAVTHRHASSPT
jgi:hypothetical protein